MFVLACYRVLLPSLDSTTSQTVCVTFNAHMYGFHIRELQLIAYSSRTLSTRVVWSEQGTQGFNWFYMAVTVRDLQPDERVRKQACCNHRKISLEIAAE